MHLCIVTHLICILITIIIEYIRILAQACTAEVVAVHAENFAVLDGSVNFSCEHVS